MKFIRSIAVVILVLATFASAQTDPRLAFVKGEAKKSDARYELLDKALTNLETKYAQDSGQQAKVPRQYIILVDNVDQWAKEFSKVTGISFTSKQVEEMKGDVMFTLSTPDRLPVFVNTSSQTWQNVWGLYQDSRGRELAVCMAKATLDHEFVYHVAMKGNDELEAHKLQRQSFLDCTANLKPGAWQDVAKSYVQMLDSIIVDISKEQTRTIASR